MKGPWTAEFTDTPYAEIGEGWVVDGPDGSICTLDCPLDEREAAARLIAAAPELYEAARLFLEYDAGDETDGVALMLAYNIALEAARVALAKARGEQ
jgi:hypothetical protein